MTSAETYTAKVIGYNSTDDVALLQLVGASGLKTVSLGNSNKVKVGEAVLALGNAGGRGGLPSTAQGTIQALNQSIKASDQGADTTESLHGMLETNAPIQEGDSGGPLVNGSGQVVGMDTAANSGAGEGGGDTTATQGFAIPINKAVSIADEIGDGQGLDHRAHRPGRLHGRQRRPTPPSRPSAGPAATGSAGSAVHPGGQLGRAGLRRLPGRAGRDGRPGRR